MSTKAERGTKRTCQNPECGSRFYDLNRDPIVCPICQTVFQQAISADAQSAVPTGQEAGTRGAARRGGFAHGPAEKPADVAPAAEDDEDALPALEGEEEAEVAEDDETFLEPEEEDGSDMETIIGPVAETDEPDR
jgi:uncharacterized protein (TIGR02300 family)